MPRRGEPMCKPVTFFSEGVKLAGDLYLPDDLARGEKRAGIVLCHGYTGVRNIFVSGTPEDGTMLQPIADRRLHGLPRSRAAVFKTLPFLCWSKKLSRSAA
jgi:hypothetical protein